jgi:hypothetical protein
MTVIPRTPEQVTFTLSNPIYGGMPTLGMTSTATSFITRLEGHRMVADVAMEIDTLTTLLANTTRIVVFGSENGLNVAEPGVWHARTFTGNQLPLGFEAMVNQAYRIVVTGDSIVHPNTVTPTPTTANLATVGDTIFLTTAAPIGMVQVPEAVRRAVGVVDTITDFNVFWDPATGLAWRDATVLVAGEGTRTVRVPSGTPAQPIAGQLIELEMVGTTWRMYNYGNQFGQTLTAMNGLNNFSRELTGQNVLASDTATFDTATPPARLVPVAARRVPITSQDFATTRNIATAAGLSVNNLGAPHVFMAEVTNWNSALRLVTFCGGFGTRSIQGTNVDTIPVLIAYAPLGTSPNFTHNRAVRIRDNALSARDIGRINRTNETGANDPVWAMVWTDPVDSLRIVAMAIILDTPTPAAPTT